jgi:signal transduction histidine kinase
MTDKTADSRGGLPHSAGNRAGARCGPWQAPRDVVFSHVEAAMLRVLRATLRYYRELILAGAFAALAAWEILEMLLLERAPDTPLSLALVVHSLQVVLILAATALALRAWREKTAREGALGTLVEQVVVAQEEERRRVAYDVHDGVAQLVVSAKQHVDTAVDLWATAPERAASETAIAAERLAQAIVETRRILAALRPLAVDAAGLAAAARRSLEDVARDTGWSVSLVENLEGARLPPTVEAAAFRILQEALSNARKHAGTTRIEVVLAREADRFLLDVRDHGVGLARSGEARGLGLASMQERARLLGGSCVVEPAPGGGTRVHAQLPLRHGLAATS